VFEHSQAVLEISRDDVRHGEALGTLTLYVERGGAVQCDSTLTAHDTAPPTPLWPNVDGDDYPCNQHIRYRFQLATPNRSE
jgi:hypothetical protein